VEGGEGDFGDFLSIRDSASVLPSEVGVAGGRQERLTRSLFNIHRLPLPMYLLTPFQVVKRKRDLSSIPGL
jgi:hypothetical protein